jgi:hypothetical protein
MFDRGTLRDRTVARHWGKNPLASNHVRPTDLMIQVAIVFVHLHGRNIHFDVELLHRSYCDEGRTVIRP